VVDSHFQNPGPASTGNNSSNSDVVGRHIDFPQFGILTHKEHYEHFKVVFQSGSYQTGFCFPSERQIRMPNWNISKLKETVG